MNEGNEFGNTECEKLKSEAKYKRLKLISNENSEILVFKNEIKLQSSNELTPTLINYDPEIFLVDDPSKIEEILSSVKEKITNEFKIFLPYKEIISEFFKDKKVEELLKDKEALQYLDLDAIDQMVDNKYLNYSEESKLEIKLALLMSKSLTQIDNCSKSIFSDLEDVKEKLFSTTNVKNKNLLLLDIDSEIRKTEFHNFLKEKLDKEGNLAKLLEEKKKNEKFIEDNRKKIKSDETSLFNSYYCIKCHIRARNAVSRSCQHLVFCEECIKLTKICPKCGLDIIEYVKIYRS